MQRHPAALQRLPHHALVDHRVHQLVARKQEGGVADVTRPNGRSSTSPGCLSSQATGVQPQASSMPAHEVDAADAGVALGA